MNILRSRNIAFYSLSIIVFLFSLTEGTVIAKELQAKVSLTGSVWRSTNNYFGNNGDTLRMGQNDVTLGNTRFERGWGIFNIKNLPKNAKISKVRLRFDCKKTYTDDPTGTMFSAEIGPLTCGNVDWSKMNNEQRWQRDGTGAFYKSSYRIQLSSTDKKNDSWLVLNSSACSIVASKAGEYVIFHFRLATQNDVWKKSPSWKGDSYHSDSVIPDWARIEYKWGKYDIQKTINDNWLMEFSDLILVIEYTT